MAAFIPSRRDESVNAQALERVTSDKQREANDGFDGSWVAHPDLVPICRDAFDAVLGERPTNSSAPVTKVQARGESTSRLAPFRSGAEITDAGLRNDVSVALQYVESWLKGVGAAAIFNLMEDRGNGGGARSQILAVAPHQVKLLRRPGRHRRDVAHDSRRRARQDSGACGRGSGLQPRKVRPRRVSCSRTLRCRCYFRSRVLKRQRKHCHFAPAKHGPRP